MGLAGVALVVLAGCDTADPPAGDATPDDPPPGEPGPDEADGIAAVGVTAEPCPDAIDEELGCIHLGSLVDRSDPRASDHGGQLLEGQRDFWRRVNEAGGVAGHELHLADHIRDVTDDADEQVTATEELLDEVLAVALLPGDATSDRLVDTLDDQDAVGVLPGWWSGWHADDRRNTLLLPADHSACLGAAIGLDWYAAAIETPVSVLALAPEGSLGSDVGAGARAWAEATGADWRGLTQTATLEEGDQQDAAVQSVLEHAPDVVVVGTAAPETGELVRKAAANGFEGTFLGVVGTWQPHLLEDPEQAQALQALYRHVGPWDDLLPTEDVGAAIREARGDEPLTAGYLTGWLSSYPLLAALRAAGDRDELTRPGVRAVLGDLEVDREGAMPPTDLADVPELRGVISAPDPEAAWGLSAAGFGVHGLADDDFDHPGDCT